MFFIFFLGGRGCYIKNPSHLIRTLWANAMPTVLRKRASQLPSPWEQHFHCGHPVLQTQNIIAIFLYVNGASQSSRIEKPRRNENFMFRTERNCVPFPSDVNRCPGAPLWAFFFFYCMLLLGHLTIQIHNLRTQNECQTSRGLWRQFKKVTLEERHCLHF